MKYTNPVIKGFYPDPSVCVANGKYYLVTSSFQYFPGVPLFESEDLINWKQIGHVLTRKSQVMLEKINSSGGVFAPTIRFHSGEPAHEKSPSAMGRPTSRDELGTNEGRFYMVTTNDTTHQNFYVYTDDIYGEWSEPIFVDQGGIDPSLLFDDDGKVYFISNGQDDYGEGGVVQCEIDIKTGKKLSKSKSIWKGSGGRYLESPHMYKIYGEPAHLKWPSAMGRPTSRAELGTIAGEYYLMAAEGGTEYGHMVTYARAKSPWGPFENYLANPVLTNRNKAPFIIQGIGHGDLVQDKKGDWHIFTLGFRQIHIWQPYHHLGREVFLTPVRFDEDGWFTAGNDGTTDFEYEMAGDFEQEGLKPYTFENTDWNIDWCFMRHPHMENYELAVDGAVLKGTDIALDDVDSPTFVALRQRDFDMDFGVDVSVDAGGSCEGGITVYMCENEHYDLSVCCENGEYYAVLKLNIGGVKHTQTKIRIAQGSAKLIIRADSLTYKFFVDDGTGEVGLGYAQTKYLSSEVSGGFTGVLTGLYAVGDGTAGFRNLRIEY